MSRRSEIVIDGAQGEGGGQIVRTALALSTITGRSVRIEHVRARRAKPGLQAQHLAAVRAAAHICDAETSGAEIGAATLSFRPREAPRAGDYIFDVAEARAGGSAGAATLVLQTALLPAFFAEGDTRLRIRGGTHVPRSPPFDFIADAWTPLLGRMNISLIVALLRYGFYPAGGGEIEVLVEGQGRNAAASLWSLDLPEKGALRSVRIHAIAANLPAHIPQRMVDRARMLLESVAPRIDSGFEVTQAASAGTGVFLAADYAALCCAFGALGARGKPAEAVAEEAVEELLRHHRCGAALDRHLADQMLLPLAFPHRPSSFTAEAVTPHLMTNAQVIQQFGLAQISIEPRVDGTAFVRVRPVDACADR